MEDKQQQQHQWRATGPPGAQRTCEDAQGPCRRHLGAGSGLTAACAVLSLLALGLCAAGLLRATELQARLSSLEEQQLGPAVLARLDLILEEVQTHSLIGVLNYDCLN